MTVAAAAVAVWGFVQGYPTVIYDSWGYGYLREILLTKGLLAWPTDLRTYGYPAFLALVSAFQILPSEELRLLVFAVQLAVFLGACAFVAARLARLYRSEEVGVWAFALGAANPVLLLHTGEVLSDLLSAVLVQLAVAFCWRLPDGSRRGGTTASAFLSFLCAGAAVAVRPANAVVAAALALVWLIRVLRWRERPVALAFARSVAAAAAGLILPVIPQLLINWFVFGQVNPLIVKSLYRMQAQWGMGALKYATVVISGHSPFLVYINPLYRGDPSPRSFFLHHPLDYAATLALHGFAMLDYDHPFTFVTRFQVWYRWPLALINFSLLMLALAGCLLAAARLARSRRIDEIAFAQWSTILVSGAYLAVYLPVEVENRFGLTLEALMTPLLVASLVWYFRESAGRPALRMALAASLLAGVAAAILLSAWISTKQTNPRENSPANAFVLDPKRARPAATPAPR